MKNQRIGEEIKAVLRLWKGVVYMRSGTDEAYICHKVRALSNSSTAISKSGFWKPGKTAIRPGLNHLMSLIVRIGLG